jgi:hypothetical protein
MQCQLAGDNDAGGGRTHVIAFHIWQREFLGKVPGHGCLPTAGWTCDEPDVLHLLLLSYFTVHHVVKSVSRGSDVGMEPKDWIGR